MTEQSSGADRAAHPPYFGPRLRELREAAAARSRTSPDEAKQAILDGLACAYGLAMDSATYNAIEAGEVLPEDERFLFSVSFTLQISSAEWRNLLTRLLYDGLHELMGDRVDRIIPPGIL